MTETANPTDPADRTRLGRAVGARLRRPGPPIGRPLPSRVGSLASSVQRFAAATSRPVQVRAALRGPGEAGGTNTRPPRWWVPSAPVADAAPDARGAAPAPATRSWLAASRPVDVTALAPRTLPRAARGVPNEETYTPGGMLGNLTSSEVRVARHAEVTASGPMLTQADRQKLSAGIRRKLATSAVAAPAPAPRRTTPSRTPLEPVDVTTPPSTSVEPVETPRPSAPQEPPVETPRRGPADVTTPRKTTATPSAGDSTPGVSTSSTNDAVTRDAVTPPAGNSTPGVSTSSTNDGVTRDAVTPPGGNSTPGVSTSSTDVGGRASEAPAPAPPPAPAPWQLAGSPTRFATALRRSPTIRRLASGTHTHGGPTLRSGGPGPRMLGAGSPVRTATMGLLHGSATRPSGHVLPMPVRADTATTAASTTPQAARREIGDRSTPTTAGPVPDSGPGVSTRAPFEARKLAPQDKRSGSPGSTGGDRPTTDSTTDAGPPVVEPRERQRAGVETPGPIGSTPATAPRTTPLALAIGGTLRRSWRSDSTIAPATDVRRLSPAPKPGQVAAGTAATARAGVPPAPVHRLYAPGPRASAPAAAAQPAAATDPSPAAPHPTPALALVPAPTTTPSSAAAPGADAGVAAPPAPVGAVAMPDQIVLRRTAGHGRRAAALASGFGGDTPIQPASVTALRGGGAAAPGGGTAPPAVGWSRPALATAPATPAGSTAASVLRRTLAAPHSGPMALGAAPATDQTQLPAPPPGFSSGSWAPLPAGPPVPRSGRAAAPAAGATTRTPLTAPGSPVASVVAAAAAAAAPSTSILRRLTVAPPRVSVNPASPGSPAAGPAVPDVVRRKTSSPTSRPAQAPGTPAVPTAAAAGGSLVERSAHLFDALDQAASTVIHRKYEPAGGNSMAESSLVPAPAGFAVPEAGENPVTRDDPMTAESERARFDRLVDAVVERIEQRVVDELERRGRRQDWKVF